MPDFQSSLVDGTTSAIDVSLDQECSILTFEDNSNYSSSTEVGHLNADFATYRQLEIKSPNGSTYDYDAQGNLDASWNQGLARTNTLTRTLSTKDDDGVYNLTLFSVPDFNAAVIYTHTKANPKAVYYRGTLWRTLQTTPAGNTPTTGSLYWEEIERKDLSSKYKTTATFALTCRNLAACLEELTLEATCSVSAEMCDDDLLCSNPTFLNSLKLKVLLDGVGYASSQSKFTEASNLINAAKSICNC